MQKKRRAGSCLKASVLGEKVVKTLEITGIRANRSPPPPADTHFPRWLCHFATVSRSRPPSLQLGLFWPRARGRWPRWRDWPQTEDHFRVSSGLDGARRIRGQAKPKKGGSFVGADPSAHIQKVVGSVADKLQHDVAAAQIF